MQVNYKALSVGLGVIVLLGGTFFAGTYFANRGAKTGSKSNVSQQLQQMNQNGQGPNGAIAMGGQAPMQGGVQMGAGAPTQQAPAQQGQVQQPRQQAPTQQAPAQQGGGSGVDAQIRQLLTSYAWCSFSYSGSSTYTGGYGDSSSSERIVFSSNGVVTFSESGESYNSGGNGTAYGSGGNSITGNWKVEGGRLYLAANGSAYQDVGATLSQNSNGYPIITANGTEYYTCN